MWGFKSSIVDVTNKCRAFNFILIKSKIILFASFTYSLSNDIKLGLLR